ncbi:BTAD domain-containing putative transcriptional regulator [Phytomonospora sp. NPDC050363]|uniref:AfsR/SARP family transcriptional regulator n=1 Tax=Phytomonospora sp. NPDC050363 TaxID=3155642 RepID=UPI0033E69327
MTGSPPCRDGRRIGVDPHANPSQEPDVLIRLIGPVRVTIGDTTAPVRASKQACVLAALAARPGVPVSQAELIERVWDGDPPDSVVGALYSYVARLRATLRPTRAAIRRAGAHGYVLDIAPEEVDVHVVRAEAAALAESRAPLLERRRRACELADGVALAGIGGSWAEEFRATFAGERLNLLTGRYEAELAEGNHATVLGELAALSEAEPVCEPIAGLLMLAYYRSGRPADALSRFEAIRLRLRDDLGADPSQPLRDLHLRILDQDAGLDMPTSRPKVPATLPGEIASFTGRGGELAALDSLAETHGSPLAAITGPGGAGKTALAVHWGQARRDDFPGGRLYLNLRGFDRGDTLTAHDALTRLLVALGETGEDIPSDVDDAAERYRSLTADSGMLVVLDNARDTDHVRPLLPGAGCTTLVTSRDSLTGLVALNDARPVPVPLLSGEEAVALLAEILGDERVDAERAAAARLADLCGHLPLALRIATAVLAVDPLGTIADYAEELGAADRLRALALDGDSEAAVAANLDLSHRVLEPAARDLFDRLGALPGEDFPADLVGAVSGQSEEDTATALRRLVAAHLIERHTPGRYRMHDLVRLYAADRSRTALAPADREAIVDAFIDWHHGQAYGADDTETANRLTATEALRTHPRMWRLVMALRSTVNEGRFLDQIARAAARALRLAAHAGDTEGEFRMTTQLANLHRQQGRLGDALVLGREAVVLAKGLGPREQAAALGNLGVYLANEGDLPAAERHLTEAVDLAAATGNDRSHLISVNSLVQVCTMIGAHDKALGYLDRAGGIEAAAIDHERARLGLLRSHVLTGLGRFGEALAAIDAALSIARDTEDHYLQGWCHGWRAETLHRAGRLEEARALRREELALGERDGRSVVEADTLQRLAELEALLGEYDEAEGLLASVVAKATHRPRETAGQVALVRAIIHNGRGAYAGARGEAEAALDLFRSLPWIVKQADALKALANAHEGIGDTVSAQRCRTEAVSLAVRS